MSCKVRLTSRSQRVGWLTTRHVPIFIGVSTHGTLVSTSVLESKKKRRGMRKKEGRRGSGKGGGRRKKEEEEEKRPCLRRGGAVRSRQAEVTIDRSIRGDAREPCEGGEDACERCGGSSGHVRSGKLVPFIWWTGPGWVRIPVSAQTNTCHPFRIGLGEMANIGLSCTLLVHTPPSDMLSSSQ